MNRQHLYVKPLRMLGMSVAGLSLGAGVLLGGRIACAGDIANIIMDLYGGDGITLSEESGFGHDAHFTAVSLRSLDRLGSSLAADAGQQSFNSAVTGFKLDLETGIPERITDSLGPLLAETARTLGQNTLNVGWSYSNVRYTHFEGNRLGDLSIKFNHPDTNEDGELGPFEPFPGGPLLDFEVDQIRVDIDLELKQEIFAMFFSYGLTDRWDVGVIIPIIRMDAQAEAVATILDPTPSPSPHFFDPVTGDSATSSLSRKKTGIGDIVLRTKYNLVSEDKIQPDIAVGGQIVLPTGDEDNLLGTGNTRLQAVLIMSKTYGSITPHVNLGYEFTPGDHQRNSLKYIVGFDAVIHDWCTMAVELLGRWEHDGDGIGDSALDLAVGAKYKIYDDTFLSNGVQIPINLDQGLRAEIIYVFGIEHTFH